ncbi:GNAT family N-acetyltransferase [Novosphingobium sp.]|uniref:GNAT family N-acetyltransferase n=1 Tax=Novosphingobium sp. TaxID=1874826 RepID=UPI00333E68C3
MAALFAPGAGVTPFDRLDWLRLLAEECLPSTRCFVAVARDGDAIAALPLCETPTGLGALANWYSFIARPRFAHGGERLLAALVRSLSTQGALQFGPLPEREAALMLGAVRSAGWIGALTLDHVNHVLHAGRDFATWWASRPGQLRETVRRKGRKVAIRIACDFDAADWATYEMIYAKSWKPAEGSPAFLRRFAEMEGAAGRLRLGIASIDGEPVAAQFWTIEDGLAFIHKLAHDPAAAAHSPGTVLTHALFAMAFNEDKVDFIDFGTGDDPYKRDWMELSDVRLRLEAYHPRALRHWPKLSKLMAKTALRLVRAGVDDKAR